MERKMVLPMIVSFLLSVQVVQGAQDVHLAVRRGDIAELERILERNPDSANAPDEEGLRPIHLAIMLGRTEALGLLLRHGADANGLQTKGVYTGAPALWMAAAYRRPVMCSMLLADGADIDGRNHPGETALYAAAARGQQQIVEMLLAHGADSNIATSYGETPLLAAVTYSKIVGILLERGANPNVLSHTMPRGSPLWLHRPSPLHRAAVCSAVTSADLLLEHGADPHTTDPLGRTPLYLAIRYAEGREQIAELILEGVRRDPMQKAAAVGDVDALRGMLDDTPELAEKRDENGWTPLHWAAWRGWSDAAELLLGAGAQGDARTEGGLRALHLASHRGHPAVVEALMAAGADANAVGCDGVTALHLAAYFGHCDVMRCLLRAGAEVHALDKEGVTPLVAATRYRKLAAVDVLLTAGADVNAVGPGGLTPLFDGIRDFDMARTMLEAGADPNVECDLGSPLHGVGHRDVALLLLRRGASVHARDPGGATPLHSAARWDVPTVARVLIEAGADVEARDDEGRTPLHAAVQGVWHGGIAPVTSLPGAEVVELLLTRGADVNARDAKGVTPLHLAAEYGHTTVAGLLIDAGADVNAVDGRGRTPLWRAMWNAHDETAGLLREHGAVEEPPD